MDVSPVTAATLTWLNVAIGLSFIIVNALTSSVLHLGVGNALITSSCRCVVQLAIMALVLRNVFEANSPWVVGGMGCILVILGAFEAVTNQAKKRYSFMFVSVLLSILGSTVPVSIIGVRYAVDVNPFWTPDQYIPILGMLCGSAVSGITVAVTYVMKELYDNRDKVETYLAFGASRFEACLPIAREALRLALTPTVNQMSVIGIIAIPGTMTGAILGGSSVEQASKLQMIIMFMLSASTGLAAIMTTVITLLVVVDSEHRIRPDRVNDREHPIWRARNWVFTQIIDGVKRLAWSCFRRKQDTEWELVPRGKTNDVTLTALSRTVRGGK